MSTTDAIYATTVVILVSVEAGHLLSASDCARNPRFEVVRFLSCELSESCELGLPPLGGRAVLKSWIFREL